MRNASRAAPFTSPLHNQIKSQAARNSFDSQSRLTLSRKGLFLILYWCKLFSYLILLVRNVSAYKRRYVLTVSRRKDSAQTSWFARRQWIHQVSRSNLKTFYWIGVGLDSGRYFKYGRDTDYWLLPLAISLSMYKPIISGNILKIINFFFLLDINTSKISKGFKLMA